MKIVITNEQSIMEIDEAHIKQALRSLSELKSYRISIVYLDDPQIAVFNEKYLKHEGATDVLSFPLGPREGEIIVSAETALREAQEREIDPMGEIMLYTYHGILHILGYDDHTEEEAQEMRDKERAFLEKLGYTWSWD